MTKYMINYISCAKDFYELILRDYSSSTPKAITFVNPYSYYMIFDNDSLSHKFDFIFADGALLVMLHNFFSKRKIDRLSFDFSSMAGSLFDFANNNNLSVALVGGTKEEMSNCIVFLQRKYPSINFNNSRHGFFEDESEINDYLYSISDSIDILISGMGTPLQEEFVVKAKKITHARLFFTCGGFITQTGTKGDYYHPLIKKSGLRWLQRALGSSHVRRRLIYNYPVFVFKYISDNLRGRL